MLITLRGKGLNRPVSIYLNSYLAPRLGEQNTRNVLFIAESQDDFFCFIPTSLAAKYEFYHVKVEPRYNEGPREWQILFAIPRFRYTVEPQYNEPLYNQVLGITNDFPYPSMV